MDAGSNYTMPNQLVSSNTKNTKSWKESNGEWLTGFNRRHSTSDRRKTPEEMASNWRAVFGEMNVEDMKDTYDPLRAGDGEIDQIPFGTVAYNPIKKPLVTLFNEELLRKTDPKAVAINAEVINQKDVEFKERLFQYLGTLEQNLEGLDEKVVAERLNQLEYWKKFDQQSAHEIMGNEMLGYIFNDRYIRAKYIFNKGFQSKTVNGESVYRIGHEGEDLRIYNVDSENFVVLGLGDSDFIEDGSAWVEWGYYSVADIIAEFRLSKSEISDLYSKIDTFNSAENLFHPVEGVFLGNNAIENPEKGYSIDTSYEGPDEYFSNDYVDTNGDILVYRFEWVSQRKIGELTRFDEEDNEVVEFVDEYYVPDESRGETVEWMYVNEIWRGVKIADFYKNIEPSPVQMRSLSNPAIVRPSYVGSLITFGMNKKATALIDDVIPYSRDFNLTANKLRHMWFKHIGPIFRISKSRVPVELGMDRYLTMLKSIGISIETDFNESPGGSYSGNMQSQTPIANLSWASDMKAALDMLSYDESRIREILSMPEPRTGSLTGNEVLGTTQQALVASSTATSNLFYMHESDKERVAAVAIEYLKDIWRNSKSVKKQYILSDMSQAVLDYDATLMEEAELGVIMSNSDEMLKIEQDMNMLGHAFAQNGMINASDLIAIRTAKSPQEVAKKLEFAEEKKRRNDAEAAKAVEEEKMKFLQAQEAAEDKKHQRAMELLREEYRLKLDLENSKQNAMFTHQATMESARLADENGDGVVDDIELKKAEIDAQTKLEINTRESEIQMQIHKDEVALKEKELAIKQQEADTKKAMSKKSTPSK